MFDWPSGKPTMYFPNPPAFYSISDELDTVDEERYLKLQAELIRRGEQRPRIERTATCGTPARPAPGRLPIPETVEDRDTA